MNYKSAVLKEFLTMSGMPSAFYLFDTSAALMTVFYTLVFCLCQTATTGRLKQKEKQFHEKSFMRNYPLYRAQNNKKNVNFEFDRRVTDP